jgi:hypothetical protein
MADVTYASEMIAISFNILFYLEIYVMSMT